MDRVQKSEQTLSNYEITKRKVQQVFPEKDHAHIAGRFGLDMDETWLHLEFVGRPYRIRRKDGYTEYLEKGEAREAGFNEVLTILDILCDAKEDAKPSGEYALFQNFDRIMNSSSKYAGMGAFRNTEAFFDGKNELLTFVLQKMGGIPEGNGDVAFRIPIFQGLDFIIQFWNSDEDFPAQIQFLSDKNATQYMRYETLWYLVGFLTNRMKELAEEYI